MHRIAIVGPECTGKTALAHSLGQALGAPVVPEVVRTWLPALGRPYQEADLVALARAQWAAEQAATGPIVICDTNLLVLRIWSLEAYGRVDPWIVAHEGLSSYALHLLCAPDLAWEPDPMREHPHDRPRLFLRYAEALAAAGVPTEQVAGHGGDRLHSALLALARHHILPDPMPEPARVLLKGAPGQRRE